MKVLFDTNIIVDIIAKREGYMESLQLLKYCEMRKISGFVTAITITDLMYILRKHISPDYVREAVQNLILIVDVADVLKTDISSAFLNKFNDFEDAVQSSCAKRIEADYIVTRNVKDFVNSEITALLPMKLLNIITV